MLRPISRPKTFRLSFVYTNSRVVILATVWPGTSINWEDTRAGQEIAKAPVLHLSWAWPAFTGDIFRKFAFDRCYHGLEPPDFKDTLHQATVATAESANLVLHFPWPVPPDGGYAGMDCPEDPAVYIFTIQHAKGEFDAYWDILVADLTWYRISGVSSQTLSLTRIRMRRTRRSLQSYIIF